MSNNEVTTVVYHRVKEGNLEQYREWQPRITAACNQFEGYIDTQLVEPGILTRDDNEFVLVFRFESRDLLKKWIDSDIRKKLLQEAGSFTLGQPKVAIFSGLEHWFSQGDGPPRYKMTVVTFLAIWPLVHFLPGHINQYLNFGNLGNEFVATVIIVVIMSYLALPLSCKIFSFWLKN
jgi:antibiotic biosynthesis monooxygenase (ABM) superfamily enzyme